MLISGTPNRLCSQYNGDLKSSLEKPYDDWYIMCCDLVVVYILKLVFALLSDVVPWCCVRGKNKKYEIQTLTPGFTLKNWMS